MMLLYFKRIWACDALELHINSLMWYHVINNTPEPHGLCVKKWTRKRLSGSIFTPGTNCDERAFASLWPMTCDFSTQGSRCLNSKFQYLFIQALMGLPVLDGVVRHQKKKKTSDFRSVLQYFYTIILRGYYLNSTNHIHHNDYSYGTHGFLSLLKVKHA